MPRAGFHTCDFNGNTGPEQDTPGFRYTRPGRLPGDGSWGLLNRASSGSRIRRITISSFVSTGAVYTRFYLKVLSKPTTELRLFGISVSTEGTDNITYAVIDSSGFVRAYDKGNLSKTQIGISRFPLQLNRWYRFECYFLIVFSSTEAKFTSSVKITIYDESGLVEAFSVTGPKHTSGASPTYNNINIADFSSASEHDGGSVLFDDWAVDTSPVGAGGCTVLKITGPGTYQQWTTGLDWIAAQKALNPGNTDSNSYLLANSTPGNRASFTVESLSSRFVPSDAVIKSIRVVASGVLPRVDNKLFIIVDGKETQSPNIGSHASPGSFFTVSGQPSEECWFIDNSQLVKRMSYRSVVEIGILDGPSGAGTARLMGICLAVDWESPNQTAQPIIIPASPIEVLSFTYTGNGTTQKVNFPNKPSFKPNFVVIQGDNLTGTSRIWWHDGLGPDGENARFAGNQRIEGGFNLGTMPGLMRIRRGSFDVAGGASSINESTIIFRVLAAFDPTNKFIQYGQSSFSADDISVDNVIAALANSSFVTEAAFAGGLNYDVFFAVTTKLFYRSNQYIGDSSAVMDAGVANLADAIQSVSVPGFLEFGTLPMVSNVDSTEWIALNRVFLNNPLFIFGNYTGNGAGSRIITFTPAGSEALLIVIPSNTTNKFYRFFNDGLGTTSRIWNGSGTSTTAITEFIVNGQFTVDSTLNANTVVYHWIIFRAGEFKPEDKSGIYIGKGKNDTYNDKVPRKIPKPFVKTGLISG